MERGPLSSTTTSSKPEGAVHCIKVMSIRIYMHAILMYCMKGDWKLVHAHLPVSPVVILLAALVSPTVL